MKKLLGSVFPESISNKAEKDNVISMLSYHSIHPEVMLN